MLSSPRACADNIGSLCLVKVCVELSEEMFGCVVVEKLIQGEDVDFRSMKKVFLQRLQHVHSEV